MSLRKSVRSPERKKTVRGTVFAGETVKLTFGEENYMQQLVVMLEMFLGRVTIADHVSKEAPASPFAKKSAYAPLRPAPSGHPGRQEEQCVVFSRQPWCLDPCARHLQ